MADSNTTLYKLVKPEVGASADTWGSKTNADWDSVDKLLGAITTAGSANAYTLTTGQSLAAYATGQRFRLKLSFSNTGSATLNVDSIGAKTIKKRDASTNVSSGDLASGAIVTVTYNGTYFLLETPVASDLSFQPLDATLTAWGGVTFAADTLGYSTGVDAFATIAFPSASRTQIAAGLGTAAVVADGTSGAVYGKLNANKTDSGNNTFSGTNAFAYDGVTVFRRTTATAYLIEFDTGGANVRGYLGADATKSFIAYTAGGSEVFSLNNSTGVGVFSARPTFNGNTALDTNNGAQLGATNTFTSTQKITGAAPALWFYETDQSLPVGLWRVLANGGNLYVQRNTDAGGAFATTSTTLILSTSDTASFVGDVVIASAAPTTDLSVGFRRFTPASITTGTPVAADSGKTIYATGGVTVPNSVFSAHDGYGIKAGASARTITQGSGVTLTNGNTGATGGVTLAANGYATVIHDSASAATVYGNV